MFDRKLLCFCLAGFATLGSVPASAAFVTFNDRAAFNAANPGTTAQNFNGAPLASTPTSVTYNDVTFSCTGTTYCPGFFGTRNLGNGGSGSVYFATPDTATFTFTSAISALGIDMLGLGTVGGSTTITATVNGQQIVVGTFQNASAFFGLNGENFTAVTFSGTAPDDGIDFDDLAYRFAGVGGTVPEPSAWALMILGFGLVGAAMRRRRQAVRIGHA